MNLDIALGVYCADNIFLREFFWLRLRLISLFNGAIATSPILGA